MVSSFFLFLLQLQINTTIKVIHYAVPSVERYKLILSPPKIALASSKNLLTTKKSKKPKEKENTGTVKRKRGEMAVPHNFMEWINLTVSYAICFQIENLECNDDKS